MGLARCLLVNNTVPARCYMENVKTGQFCAKPFSTSGNTIDGGCMQQTATEFAGTNDCFVDNFSAVVE